MDYSKPLNPNDLFSAKGLVVVVTGGGTGIGRSYVHALAANGAAKVFLLGRRLETLQETARAAAPSSETSSSAVVIPIQCDITSSESLSAAVKTIKEQSGGYVDVLINNAGVGGPQTTDVSTATTIEELSAAMSRGIGNSDGSGSDDWDATWRTNVVAVVQTSAALLPLLEAANVRRGWTAGKRNADEFQIQDIEVLKKNGLDADDRRAAQIITTTSISGLNRAVTLGLAYTVSKAAAIMLGKTLASFLAPWNIRSNIIAPGRFPSEMMTDRSPHIATGLIPQGASGTHDDQVSLILYLVGKSGTYLNGTVNVIDGGRLSIMPATF